MPEAAIPWPDVLIVDVNHTAVMNSPFALLKGSILCELPSQSSNLCFRQALPYSTLSQTLSHYPFLNPLHHFLLAFSLSLLSNACATKIMGLNY